METTDPITGKCVSGIPPNACSLCNNKQEGASCDDGDPNTVNTVWQEQVPTTMKYRVEVISTRNSQSPAWPDRAAHFSWIGGANHNDSVKFWEIGTLASSGIDLMSITGITTDLILEVETEITNGNAQNLIDQQHWFCPDEIDHPSCGELSFDILVSKEFPLVTLVSVLGPILDWFIGAESLSMIDNGGILFLK